jgi:hypothetical protein
VSLARFLLIFYILQLFNFAPSDAACGRVNGVFCNGGVCAAGICQCPTHLVGENWSVARLCLFFLCVIFFVCLCVCRCV